MTNARHQLKPAWFWSAIGIIFPAFVGVGFLAFFVIDRREIFARLSSPILDNNNGLPFAWALLAIVLLGLQVRRVSGSRLLWSLRTVILTVVSFAMLLMVCGKTGWARYQVYRWECFHRHLGITARNRGETESEVIDLLTDQAIGQWVHSDEELLKHLAIDRAFSFARRPCEARLAWGSLHQCGVASEDLLAEPNGKTFLLYALAGDVHGVPEGQLAWLAQGDGAKRSGKAFNGGLIRKDEAAKLLQSKIESIDSLPDNQLEALMFCVANFRDLVEASQRDAVQDAWLERIPELSTLLAEGYSLGESLAETLDQAELTRVRITVDEDYALPYKDKFNQVLLALPRSLQTLIRLNSDSRIEFVQSDDADIEIKLTAGGDVLYKYQRQVFEWRKKYKPGRIGLKMQRRHYRTGRWENERVATGEKTTQTVFGATVRLQASLPPQPIETADTLVYWQDYLRSTDKAPELESAGFNNLQGRLWPLGIHQSYLRGGDVLAEPEPL